MGKYSEYLENLFRWKSGRQNPNYSKMFLLGNPLVLPFDVYLLRFKEGSQIQPHQDKVESGRHYRLNVILLHAKEGGTFNCSNVVYETRSVKLFRPDLYEHSVSQVVSGTRYVLSIGWVLRDRTTTPNV